MLCTYCVHTVCEPVLLCCMCVCVHGSAGLYIVNVIINVNHFLKQLAQKCVLALVHVNNKKCGPQLN